MADTQANGKDSRAPVKTFTRTLVEALGDHLNAKITGPSDDMSKNLNSKKEWHPSRYENRRAVEEYKERAGRQSEDEILRILREDAGDVEYVSHQYNAE